jgi:hypothetical protein
VEERVEKSTIHLLGNPSKVQESGALGMLINFAFWLREVSLHILVPRLPFRTRILIVLTPQRGPPKSQSSLSNHHEMNSS